MFESQFRRVPHAAGELSPRATITEACQPLSLSSGTGENFAVRSPLTTSKEQPSPLQLETTRAQQCRPSTVQNKQLNSIFKSQHQGKFLKTHFSKEDMHITNAPNMLSIVIREMPKTTRYFYTFNNH